MDREKTVLARLKKVSNLIDRHMMEVKSRLANTVGEAKNVSAIQGRIILFLYSATQKGEVFQKDIETYFDIRSSTAAIVLGRMENNKLITRETSAADERKKTVKLTQKAKKLQPLAEAEVDKAEALITRGLTRDELRVFLRVLEKISENLA